jgi:hypothetical protein
MQSIAEFMAESYRSNTPLTWDVTGVSLATAAFAVDLVKVVVSFESREAAGPWYVANGDCSLGICHLQRRVAGHGRISGYARAGKGYLRHQTG